MTAYYNEWEPYPAQWLRNLIVAGLIAPGDVDTRSIEEVTADDIKGYAQVHMFAGLGVWSYALRQAGWDDDRPVWSCSCPCQPFSSAGKRKAFDDARHLWPHAFRLISQCRPGVVFGEQVSGKNGLAWLDAVQTDLEGRGYAVGALGVSAAGVGAPHIRKRLYFVADAEWDSDRGCGPGAVTGAATGVQGEDGQRQRIRSDSGAGCAAGVDVRPDAQGEQVGTAGQSWGEAGNPLRGFWADCEWLPTIDGRWMPTQRGIFPMVVGHPGRVEQLRAYGNSLCAETAIEFVKAYMECRRR